MKLFGSLADTILCGVPNYDLSPLDEITNPMVPANLYRHFTPDEFEVLLSTGGFSLIEGYIQNDEPGARSLSRLKHVNSMT